MRNNQFFYLQLYIILELFLLFSSSARAQVPQSLKVLEVRVEGTVSADPGLVIANSGLVIGKNITGEDVQKAIHRLHALGMFRKIEVLLEREVPDGAFFLIRVEEYPRIADIEIKGNKKIKKKEIEEAHSLYRGQVLNPSKIKKATADLLKIYYEKGYLLAKVEPEIKDSTEPNKKNLLLVISEGKKVKIDEITFSGNEAFSDGKLRKQLDNTHQRSLLGFWHRGVFDKSKFQEDLEKISTFYHNNGFRDAEVVRDTIVYSENRKRMNIEIEVKEGGKYYFGNVSFEGNLLFRDEELLAQLEFRPSDVYSEEKLQFTTTERLGTLYYDRGYIYSRIEPILLPVGEDTLDVHFSVMEGNQYKVRMINIIGNDKTKEKVIRRECVLYPGETFDVSKLRRSIREITILNYFANIQPDIQQVSDDEVDLYIDVEEKPTDQANLSAGYSERDGMIGAVGFTMPNLFGNGQQFSLDWNFGQVYRSFSISFTEPWLFNTPTLARVSFFDLRRGGYYYGFDESVTGATFHLGRRFRWPDDYFRGDWVYRIDRTLYDNFTESFKEQYSDSYGITEGETRISSTMTQTITRDSRDNPEFPTRGSVNYYQIELAGSFLSGDDQYVKQTFNLEWYLPVTSKLVLYSKSRAGLLYGLTAHNADIPPIDKFYMGGSGLSFGEPLRGYEDRDVGPSTGGLSFLKQTLELRVPLLPNPTVFGLGFFDAGKTWATVSETDLNDLWRSVGFGVRLYMPMIGLIGLDYGYGFDYPAYDEHGRLNGKRRGQWIPHFQFGRTF